MTLRGVSGVLATSAVLLAPFTWSYIGSIGGVLIRAVDILLLMSLLVMALRLRLAILPILVPACLFGLICLSFLRAIIHNDPESTVSALKIGYYLISVLVLATTFREMASNRDHKSILYALLLVSPILIIFLIGVGEIFLNLLQSRSLLSMSQVMFRGWNELFSQNLFGVSDFRQVVGVEFRNSAGMAFMVAALFFFMWDGKINRATTIILMVIAAMMFSRSVWLIQLLFFALVILRGRGASRAAWLFVILCGAVAAFLAPAFNEALSDRINSPLGRSEMLDAALSEFNSSVLFGRAEGARVVLGDGEYNDVHNVPLAFALKTGILGFLLSVTIALSFLATAVSRTVLLFSRKPVDHKRTIVVILLSTILFVRPLVSASHDIYFSIGEWCALAILLALQKELGCQRRMQAAQIAQPAVSRGHRQR
ncbi:MAG: hypothetical protein KKF88_05780 [Alphaproteobacteria bacterium]|nr:hypothetical protein [Alphaproteobacteria bacterium]